MILLKNFPFWQRRIFRWKISWRNKIIPWERNVELKYGWRECNDIFPPRIVYDEWREGNVMYNRCERAKRQSWTGAKLLAKVCLVKDGGKIKVVVDEPLSEELSNRWSKTTGSWTRHGNSIFLPRAHFPKVWPRNNERRKISSSPSFSLLLNAKKWISKISLEEENFFLEFLEYFLYIQYYP